MKVFFHGYYPQASDIPRPTPILLTPSPGHANRYHRSWRETATETDGTRSRTLLDASRTAHGPTATQAGPTGPAGGVAGGTTARGLPPVA